ncbi:BspA family leucine-rich repeat surface protein [Lactobacillus sp. ESL0684]|uniref:BspA family leucine-rich repeat surface protein n=1 Tax=Lactobacillus sp. ESL0684 TaxID=2983213 RepID=UPI0023F7774E|nr:BspA family leucine-rich repeat surface protein [Lactobacillus sp. ESL0684]WEV43799.1 BspA family leucine-rich repeat surface protein [Lactobacillus sp. ESL0684]
MTNSDKKSLTKISHKVLDKVDTSQVTDMHKMFAFYPKLKSLDVSNFRTQKVTSMMAMFHKVLGPIEGIDNFDFSSINE